MFVVPSETYEAVLDAGESSLVGTVGIVVIDNQGGTTQAFSSAGIIESPTGSGVYAATRTAPATTGQYTIIWTRGSGGETLGVEDLVVSGEVSTASIPVSADDWPHGPCELWISGSDVADCCDTEVGSDVDLLDDVAEMASYLLFELTGQRFPGICQRTIRPCRDGCGCWEGLDWIGHACSVPRCGCNTESYIRLAGRPIREIVEVKVDGDVIDPAEYRLEENQRLLRLHDPGPPVIARVWPSCQNIALDDDQVGTFSITYTYGTGPPLLGRRAAAQLACELWKACPGNTGECALPNKVTRIIRQGVTIEKIVPLAELLKEGATGLQLVDSFLAAANRGAKRQPAVWSPDVPSFGRRVG